MGCSCLKPNTVVKSKLVPSRKLLINNNNNNNIINQDNNSRLVIVNEQNNNQLGQASINQNQISSEAIKYNGQNKNSNNPERNNHDNIISNEDNNIQIMNLNNNSQQRNNEQINNRQSNNNRHQPRVNAELLMAQAQNYSNFQPYLISQHEPDFNYPELPDAYTGIGIKRMKAYISPVSSEELEKVRENFWTSRIEGNPEIWELLRVVCSDKSLTEDDVMGMLRAGGIVPFLDSLSAVYDSKGFLYEIPNYCINDPICYDIPNADCNKSKPKEDIIKIIVRFFSEQLEFKVSNYFTIEKLKEFILEGNGFKLEKSGLRLFYGGKELKNDKELWLYNISNKSIIQLLGKKSENQTNANSNINQELKEKDSAEIGVKDDDNLKTLNESIMKKFINNDKPENDKNEINNNPEPKNNDLISAKNTINTQAMINNNLKEKEDVIKLTQDKDNILLKDNNDEKIIEANKLTKGKEDIKESDIHSHQPNEKENDIMEI